MTKYQLAKLLAVAGRLDSRKRVQKLVHLLQAAGCRLDAEYRLHYYGPYSAEVAGLLDEMSAAGILSESARSFPFGEQYAYEFNDEFRDSLTRYERTQGGMIAKAQLEKYEKTIEKLRDVDLKELELASTIVCFRQAGSEWEDAVQRTCTFKSRTPGSQEIRNAEQLAREVAG